MDLTVMDNNSKMTLSQLVESGADIESNVPQDEALDYIHSRETVKGEDLFHVQEVMKSIGVLFYTDKDSLDDVLEKVFDFSEEALSMSNSKRYTGDCLMIFRTSFNTSKSNAAEVLFERTEDISWGEECYSARMAVGKFGEKVYPTHAAHSYSFAGEAAREIFEITEDINWCKKWYIAKGLAADKIAKFDSYSAACAYSFAADAAQRYYKFTGNKQVAKKAIKWSRKFLDYFEANPDPKQNETMQNVRASVDFLKYHIKLKRR